MSRYTRLCSPWPARTGVARCAEYRVTVECGWKRLRTPMKRWRPTSARTRTPVLFFLFFLLPLLWRRPPTTYAKAAEHVTTLSGSLPLAVTHATPLQHTARPSPRFHLA